MSRLAAIRSKRRSDLIDAIRECEAVLKKARQGADYRKAFTAMLRAGARYDTARDLERDDAFDDLSLFGCEPDEVESALDDATESALETLLALRGSLTP